MDHDRFKMHGVLHWYSANIYIQLSNHYGCLRLRITLMAGAAKLRRGRAICPYLILVSSRVWESGRNLGFFIFEVFVEWSLWSFSFLNLFAHGRKKGTKTSFTLWCWAVIRRGCIQCLSGSVTFPCRWICKQHFHSEVDSPALPGVLMHHMSKYLSKFFPLKKNNSVWVCIRRTRANLLGKGKFACFLWAFDGFGALWIIPLVWSRERDRFLLSSKQADSGHSK